MTDEAPFGEIDVDEVFASDSYIYHTARNEEPDGVEADDYVLLILKQPIGREVGYFGLALTTAELFQSHIMNENKCSIVGYPGDKITV